MGNRRTSTIFWHRLNGLTYKILTLNAFLLALIYIFAASYAYADNEYLERITITPPIPASAYQTPYIENDNYQIKSHVKYRGQKRSYQLYAPSGYSRTAKPAIILLHGAKRTGVSMIDKWRGLADKEDIILIAPTAIDGIWTKHDNTALFDLIMAQVDKGYKIDRSRLYLFGHSLGGQLALSLALTHPKYFAATAVHAGAWENFPIFSGALKTRKMPVALFNGTHDKAVPLSNVEDTAQNFAKQRHKTKLFVLDGHDHWYYDIAFFINKKAWAFFEDYKL